MFKNLQSGLQKAEIYKSNKGIWVPQVERGIDKPFRKTPDRCVLEYLNYINTLKYQN